MARQRSFVAMTPEGTRRSLMRMGECVPDSKNPRRVYLIGHSAYRKRVRISLRHFRTRVFPALFFARIGIFVGIVFRNHAESAVHASIG